MNKLLKIIIYIAGVITGLIAGYILSNKYHHTYNNSASCKGCEVEFDKGYNLGMRDANTDWSQWR
jgi:hypothetical protein